MVIFTSKPLHIFLTHFIIFECCPPIYSNHVVIWTSPPSNISSGGGGHHLMINLSHSFFSSDKTVCTGLLLASTTSLLSFVRLPCLVSSPYHRPPNCQITFSSLHNCTEILSSSMPNTYTNYDTLNLTPSIIPSGLAPCLNIELYAFLCGSLFLSALCNHTVNCYDYIMLAPDKWRVHSPGGVILMGKT
jgi:hypothetical protein